MTDILKPRDAKEVEDAVRWALADDKALEVAGQGTKRSLGRPSQTDLTLDLSGLSGVTLYEPEELVLSAKAGTPLAEIETLLDANNQQLAFEPMDYGPLLGGSARWGTLGAMTDITVKVLPKAETEATVIVEGLDDARACAAMAAAMGSSCDVSGAAHLPDHVASYFDGLPRPEAATALRLEGFPPSVKHRKEALAALMKPFGPVALLDEKDSRALWRSVRQVKPFASDAARERPLWRISTAPSKGHEIARLITPAAQMFYDWAGGLIWAAMPFAHEPDAAAIRGAVA